ncbi:MAG TPA: hypothetical protein PKW76_13400 [bacterium]|nr:hypothetical protein [bacterium]HPG46666.1 hypothetical protein [bacterium]
MNFAFRLTSLNFATPEAPFYWIAVSRPPASSRPPSEPGFMGSIELQKGNRQSSTIAQVAACCQPLSLERQPNICQAPAEPAKVLFPLYSLRNKILTAE